MVGPLAFRFRINDDLSSGIHLYARSSNRSKQVPEYVTHDCILSQLQENVAAVSRNRPAADVQLSTLKSLANRQHGSIDDHHADNGRLSLQGIMFHRRRSDTYLRHEYM